MSNLSIETLQPAGPKEMARSASYPGRKVSEGDLRWDTHPHVTPNYRNWAEGNKTNGIATRPNIDYDGEPDIDASRRASSE